MHKLKNLALAVVLTMTGLLLACEGEDSSPGQVTPPPPLTNVTPTPEPKQPKSHQYNICSFNVQFLGSSRLRRNDDLAHYVASNECDLVAVQELVAPPENSGLTAFPDGSEIRGNDRATAYFTAMQAAGYDAYWLSEEDSGSSEKNHSNATNTEWHVVFYKTSKFQRAVDLPSGYIAEDVTRHPDFDRVPYAFSFRDVTGNIDFTLINVHLHPDKSSKDKLRRAQELTAISNWINANSNVEKDFIILGDMNIQDAKELANLEQITKLTSLNTNAKWMTNTLQTQPRPYDHVMLDPRFTTEVQLLENFDVLNLVDDMAKLWEPTDIYPGNPYIHDVFRMYFSDHHAVRFRITTGTADDD